MRRIGDRAFCCCGLVEFEAPESLEEIGEDAFCNCERLEHVTLNPGLRTVGKDAFLNTAFEERWTFIKDGLLPEDICPWE